MPYEDLPSVDKYILGVFSELCVEVDTAYANFQFFRASQALLRFCSNDLSSFYLDVAKDRLYISDEDSFRRRSAQTVISILVHGLAKVCVTLDISLVCLVSVSLCLSTSLSIYNI